MSRKRRRRRHLPPQPPQPPAVAVPAATPAPAQDRREAGLQELRDLGLLLAREAKDNPPDQTALRISLAQVSRILVELDEDPLRDKLQGDLALYISLLNAVARLCREERGSADKNLKSQRGSKDADGSKGLSPGTVTNIEQQMSLF